MKLKFALPVLILLVGIAYSFTPSRNMEFLTELVDLDLDEKPVSATLTHMDILRKGLIRSLTKYFAETQRNFTSSTSKHTVRLDKADTVYYERIDELYKDFLGVDEYEAISSCGLAVASAINEMTDAVANVDFDTHLKDLPWAHFDANTFVESNRHVRKLMDAVYSEVLIHQNMASARQKIGSLLHTVHDFYSHSNWIELGNADRINNLIGKRGVDFDLTELNLTIVSKNDIACMSEKCTKKVLKCNHLKSLASLVRYFVVGGGSNLSMTCPLVYYKCANNVIARGKLTSGYFSGQRLESGAAITKPLNSSLCSHGGAFDATSQQPALGGINKDTAYYFLSPRADLHSTAAELAVRHTEKIFDDVRSSLGNLVFDELLQLFHTDKPSIFCVFKRVFSYG